MHSRHPRHLIEKGRRDSTTMRSEPGALATRRLNTHAIIRARSLPLPGSDTFLFRHVREFGLAFRVISCKAKRGEAPIYRVRKTHEIRKAAGRFNRHGSSLASERGRLKKGETIMKKAAYAMIS